MTRLLAVLALAACLGGAPAAQPKPAADPAAALLARLEQVLREGSPDAYLELLTPGADRPAAAEFAREVVLHGVTRAAVKERDRAGLPGVAPGDGARLLVEALLESGGQARLLTLQLDVGRTGPGADAPWGIASQKLVGTFQGLYRLTLDPERQVAVRDLVVTADDLKLVVPEGSLFFARAEGGPTAVVILGRGEMTFSPAPAAERSQMRVFAGSDVLQTPFDGALVRINPGDFASHVTAREMVERPPEAREFKRADDLFRQEVAKSFSLDLGDLSSDTWYVLPSAGDFLAEVRTRRFDTLTYSRVGSQIEDISLFDRKKRRNLSVYSSAAHLERYGRFYSDDETIDYRVASYGVDVRYDPESRVFQGLTSLAIQVVAPSLGTLTIRLADPLAVRAVVSPEFGRLMSMRVRGQNSVIVTLPGIVPKGTVLHLLVSYAGALDPQPVDREAVTQEVRRGILAQEEEEIPLEESDLYSNRSYWYAQAQTLGYAPATITVTVPEPWSIVASGELVSVVPAPGPVQKKARLRQFSFRAAQPVRYLSFLAAKLAPARTERLSLKTAEAATRLPRAGGVYYDDVDLAVRTNPRQHSRSRELLKTTADIVRYYTSLIGDFPYHALTVAAVERRLPGGHSPPYMTVLATPGPKSNVTWGDDPAVLPDFPDYFIAHEVAHQWWGQAVGWKNYHEQWLSEAFAQYFAALYAEHSRGAGLFDQVIRRMQNWAVAESNQGPVYLGYRVGHVKGDRRVFRAVVYDKGAMVLHMLRRLVGDEAFFGGLRRFYNTWRFQKAGTDDLRAPMEQASGLDLRRFFDQWVLGEGLPQVTCAWRTEERDGAREAVLDLEQAGEVYDVPVTVTVEQSDGRVATVLVKLADRRAEVRVPLTGAVRKVDINRDQAALGVFTARPAAPSPRDIIRGSWIPSP